MLSWFKSLLDLFLPPRCLKCGKVISGEAGLCSDCFNEMEFITEPYCKKCGYPFEMAPDGKSRLCASCARHKATPFRMLRSAVKYDEASKPLILAFKFMDHTDNAKVFASWLKFAARDILVQGVDVIVPIPLHYSRLIKRRYNQSALLARELSKLTGIPVNYDAVIRHRRTKPQVQFSGHARVKNVKGAFSIKKPEQIRGKRILLIDDVMTTGSTLKECALALRQAKAKSVDTVTVARVC